MTTKDRFPRLAEKQWWALRERFRQSIPSRVTAGYLAAALDMQERSASANILPALQEVGLIDNEGVPTERARSWRDDETYADVVREMREQIYPSELREAIPNPASQRDAAERWFANRTGHGLSAARKMAAFYELLSRTEPGSGQRQTGPPKRKRPQAVAAEPRAPRSTTPDKGFKLPGSSYPELARVVRAYLPFTDPASLNDVAVAAAMHPTAVSRNHGFLVAVLVLEGGQKKSLTRSGRTLAEGLEREMPEEIRSGWREIVLPNDFTQKILSAVRIRKGMDAQTLQSHIAYSAGQQRTPSALSGAAAFVDVLRAAGLLDESNGRIVAVDERGLGSEEKKTRAAQLTPTPTIATTETIQSAGIQLVLQVQVQCSSEELSTLAPALREIIRELRAELNNPFEG